MDQALNETWKYEDQHPDEQGILLSNRIHELCEQGLLISKYYEPKNLRPASYTLTVGDDYVDSEGTICRLTDEKNSILFPKNSVIFVSIKERFDIPFYIVARFNLRVNWVYDGILLGTGPQVDPGFSGFLSCPLYNLTNVDITIQRGEPFATIDFEKTTALLKHRPTAAERKQIIERAQDKRLLTVEDQTYSFYRASALEPLQHRKSHKIVSSLIEMRDEVKTWRKLGIGSVIAFFGLTLSLLAFGTNLYRQNADLSRQITEDKNELRQANARISKLEEELDRMLRANKQPLQTLPSAPVAREEPRNRPR